MEYLPPLFYLLVYSCKFFLPPFYIAIAAFHKVFKFCIEAFPRLLVQDASYFITVPERTEYLIYLPLSKPPIM